MRIVLTAGGTREPIDDVRVVANTSTGRLGARVADAAVQAGFDVVLLMARGARARPDATVETHWFDTSAELCDLLRQWVPEADVVIHAAAVSDYIPERSSGKLSSDAEELVIRLRRAPKLIDGLRALAPEALLVGFKLLSDVDEGRLVEAAESLRQRAHLDLVVANDAAAIGDDDHAAVLVGPRGVEARVRGKASLASALMTWIGERSQSELTTS